MSSVTISTEQVNNCLIRMLDRLDIEHEQRVKKALSDFDKLLNDFESQGWFAKLLSEKPRRNVALLIANCDSEKIRREAQASIEVIKTLLAAGTDLITISHEHSFILEE